MPTFMPIRRRFQARVPLLVLGVLLVGGMQPALARDLPDFGQVRSAFKTAARSKDIAERQRGLELLRDRPEIEALTLLLGADKEYAKELAKLVKMQEASVDAFAKAQDDLDKLNKKFTASSRSARDIASYNKNSKKIAKKLNEAKRAQGRLQTEWVALRAVQSQITEVTASVLEAAKPEDAVTMLATLFEKWGSLASETEGPRRWMAALGPAPRAEVSVELRRVATDAALLPATRGMALRALGERRDSAALDLAKRVLVDKAAHHHLAVGAVACLQALHIKAAVEPLITFLERPDLDRLREDAHGALKSLTGQTHGPYAQPWRTWWKNEGSKLELPKHPTRAPSESPEEEGVTFYGIHTFSKRVLFIVDISGSMDWALGGRRGEPGGEKAKMVTARKELLGAINSLEDGSTFNVILFNHKVVPWKKKVTEASASSRRGIAKWIEEVPPVGQTNIHDALEAGFRSILAVTGPPEVDTVFFLTDGKPTAGRIVDPPKILEAVRGWNAAAQVKLHVVGIGGSKDIDAEFLRELAHATGGKFIQRDR